MELTAWRWLRFHLALRKQCVWAPNKLVSSLPILLVAYMAALGPWPVYLRTETHGLGYRFSC